MIMLPKINNDLKAFLLDIGAQSYCLSFHTDGPPNPEYNYKLRSSVTSMIQNTEEFVTQLMALKNQSDNSQ